MRLGGFGEGLSENVCEAYSFLVNNYSPGDEVYFFGFSRGAFTVRATAGLVANIGLCADTAMDQFWMAYDAYKQRGEKPIMETDWYLHNGGNEWLANCDKNVSIEVVGVWDTVGSLGWPSNNLIDLSKRNKAYGFHDTNISPRKVSLPYDVAEENIVLGCLKHWFQTRILTDV